MTAPDKRDYATPSETAMRIYDAVSDAITDAGFVIVTTQRHGDLVNACMKAREILSYADRNDEAVSKAFDVLDEVLSSV